MNAFQPIPFHTLLSPSVGYGRRSSQAILRPTSPAAEPMSERPPESISSLQRLYTAVGATQLAGLFAAGIATSLAARFFALGFTLKPNKAGIAQLPNTSSQALKAMTKGAGVRTSVWLNWAGAEGLAGLLNFARHYPAALKGVLAYLSAYTLGEVAGSIVQGTQEVLVRQEETQIRADLLNQLTGQFRHSIQKKHAVTNQLRDTAKQRILGLLNQYQVSNPEELMNGVVEQPVERCTAYPYEPVHFSKPTSLAQAYRFNFAGSSGLETASTRLLQTPKSLAFMKGVVFGTGLIVGTLGQFVVELFRQSSAGVVLKRAKKVFNQMFTLSNTEAMFLIGDKRLLWAVLGLTAVARIGKLMLDGYREVEVTRQHANTELRYQTYSRLILDPTFHGISEEESLKNDLRLLEKALPVERLNRTLLRQHIQTLLTNVGRNSAPAYWSMVPGVQLREARN